MILSLPGTVYSPGPSYGPLAVNHGHPLSQGLTGLWVFNQAAVAPNASNVRIVNEVFGNPPASGFQPHGWTQNSHGPAIAFTAVNQGLNDLCGGSSYLRTAMIPTQRITVLMIRRKQDLTLRAGVHFGTGSGTETCKAFAPYVDGKIYWDFGGASGANRLESGVLSWGTEVDLLGFVAGANGMAIYRNGVQVASQGTAVSRTDAGVFSLNATGDLVDINFFAILNAEWLPSQMLEWMANPYAMLLRPRARRSFMTAVPAGYAFTIGGVKQNLLPNWRISEQINGRNVMSFAVNSLDGSYRPAARATTIFTDGTDRLFGGNIFDPSERGLGGYGVTPITNSASAIDFSALPDRREVALTIPAGSTYKDAMIQIVALLAPYGGALDPAQADGDTFDEDVVLEVAKVTDHLNKLSVMTGWAWQGDYYKVFRLFEPGSIPAPFNIAAGDGNVDGDIETKTSTQNYGNYITVMFTTPAVAAYAFFILTVNATDGEQLTVGSEVYPLKNTPVDPNDIQIGATIADTIDNIIGKIYPAHAEVVAFEQASDTVRVTAKEAGASGNGIQVATTCVNGSWFTEGGGAVSHLNLGSDDLLTGVVYATSGAPADERVDRTYRHPEIRDESTAQRMADGYLARDLVTPREVFFRVLQRGLHPGQSIEIVEPKRNLNTNCLITNVEITANGELFMYQIVAAEGLVIPRPKHELFKLWSRGISGAA